MWIIRLIVIVFLATVVQSFFYNYITRITCKSIGVVCRLVFENNEVNPGVCVIIRTDTNFFSRCFIGITQCYRRTTQKITYLLVPYSYFYLRCIYNPLYLVVIAISTPLQSYISHWIIQIVFALYNFFFFILRFFLLNALKNRIPFVCRRLQTCADFNFGA